MTEIVDNIRKGYSDITQHHDPRGAYRDFHELLNDTEPSAASIHELSIGSLIVPKVQTSIEATRKARISLGSGDVRYFRGSGVIAVGDVSGTIMGVKYDPRSSYRNVPMLNTDPVAGEHGNYQFVALRKLGFAALVGRVGYNNMYPDLEERYKREQEILESLGLASTGDAPHHLGHAVLSTGSSEFIAAGASGMLPSQKISDHWENTPELGAILDQGYERGWYTWQGDAAAGYHDMVAAETVLQKVMATESGVQAQMTNMAEGKWLNFAMQVNTNVVNIH